MKKSIVEARIEYASMIHFLNELNLVGWKVVQEVCNASILHMSSLKIFYQIFILYSNTTL